MKLIELFNRTIRNRTIVETSLEDTAQTTYQHLEDLLISHGANGGEAAIEALQDAVDEPAVMNLKWDGLTVIFWGRDHSGVFYLSSIKQWNNRQKLTKEQLASTFDIPYNSANSKSAGDQRIIVARTSQSYKDLWDIFENATPADFRGYMCGDLMFASPPVRNTHGEYVFTPHKVTYIVQPNGLNNKISRAQVFVVSRGLFDEFGENFSKNLRRIPASNVNQFNTTSALIVIPAEHPKVDLSIDNALLNAASDFVNKHAISIDRVANFTMSSLTNFKPILYDYAIKRITDGISFDEWIDNSTLRDDQQSMLKKASAIHGDDFKIFWEAFSKILEAKHHVIEELYDKHGEAMWNKLGIRSETDNRLGNAGYAWAMSKNQMVKLVHDNFKSSDEHKHVD